MTFNVDHVGIKHRHLQTTVVKYRHM